MTDQEITEAREDLQQFDIEQLRVGVMLQLLKIESLTKERDEYKERMQRLMTTVTELKKERDDLKAIVAGKIKTIALYRVEMLKACKERDEYKQAADTIAMQHKVERDKHCNCEFEGDPNTVQCTLHNAWAETLHEQAGFRRERDKLAAVAKLALDALSVSYPTVRSRLQAHNKAIEELQQAGGK